jgi:hypothetical protein
MYLAYVDESGNTGRPGSQTYVLGCVIVASSEWPSVFDEVIEFRRFLKRSFGVPVRTEIKSSFLIANKGPFRRLRLNEASRFAIYRQAMRLQHKLGLSTFAIVIDKERLHTRDPALNPRDVAWEFLFQRIERLTMKKPLGPTWAMVIHDEGEGAAVRKLARRARRIGTAGSAFGTGSLKLPLQRLVDDPVPRNSTQSYFVQLADLSAYAAFRRLYPPPVRPVQIVPQSMWDELQEARYAPANTLVGGVRGIVHWPRT